MFLHRVKMNWKKHQTLTLTILLVALTRIVLENGFGEAPLSGYAILQIGDERHLTLAGLPLDRGRTNISVESGEIRELNLTQPR